MNILKVLAIVSVLFLTACESGKKSTSNAFSKPVVKTSGVKMYAGKPAAAVEMSYVIAKNIVAGEAVDILLTFTNTKDIDNLIISFKMDSGLTVVDALQQYHFGVLAAGETSQLTLRVSAANDGYYYIHILATLVTGKNQSRSFVIPVNVGNVDVQKSLKAAGKVKTDSAGRRIISMPAQMLK